MFCKVDRTISRNASAYQSPKQKKITHNRRLLIAFQTTLPRQTFHKTSVRSIVAALVFCFLIPPDAAGQVHSPWQRHSLDTNPPSGSDGVKLADVNGDGYPDMVTGFEEDGVSRIYLHPGAAGVKKDSWEYVELPSPNVEDAFLIDLDGNGIIDLVTASEGNTNQITFHWAPDRREDYMNASLWKSQNVPATNGLAAWMFVISADMDHKHGLDLVVGSKRKKGDRGDDRALIGWLRCPSNPRDIDQWTFHPLSSAGWVMSLVLADWNGDGHTDILLSDRKNSSRKGVRWLENPGIETEDFFKEWKSHPIGHTIQEPMFLSVYDLNNDGLKDIVVPDMYRGLVFLEQTKPHEWKEHLVTYPSWAGPRGKSVAIGDLNQDGRPEIVLSFEEEGNVAQLPYETYAKNGVFSVIAGTYEKHPFSGKWTFSTISDLKGRKFDLVNLIDLDGDGDLDVLTNDENEEDTGLGIVWYENPLIK
jgi:hypothetical protein